MHIGLVPFQRRRKHGQICYQPHFLHSQDEPALLKAVDYLENRIDQSFSDIVFEELIGFFQKPKIGRAVFEVLLSRFYGASGIPSTNIPLSPSDRQKLWNFLAQTTINNLRNYEDSEKLLKGFLLEINLTLSINKAKKLLFADHQDFRTLTRLASERESAKKMIRVCNTEMFASILRNAYEINFNIQNNLPGALSRRLLFLSRRRGVYLEFKQSNTFNLRLIGPNELVGRRTKYGHALSQFTLEILSFLQHRRESFDLQVIYENFGQERQMSHSSNEIPSLDLIPLDLTQGFDSEVEMQFFTEFSAVTSPWKIEREPETLIINGKLFIPDFGLKYRKKVVLLEIVGFWTESYLQKKVERLTQLSQQLETPLLLLVDRSLSIPSLPFRIFFYDKKFPIRDILHFLEDNYRKSEFERYLSDFSSKVETIIHNFILELEKKAGYLPEENVEKIVDVYTSNELTVLFSRYSIVELLSRKGVVFIPQIGLLSDNKLQMIVKLLEKLFKGEKTVNYHQ
ncbi:MAG: DUF790 family protein, partial [Promethearchaeota archaeon]